MNATSTTRKEGSDVPSIPLLTKQNLSFKISGKETLGAFLSKKCDQLSNGRMQLYSTSHLEYFKLLKDNRPLNEAHILSLLDSFIKDGYLFTIIFVNEQIQIIDGQHRFEAARRLGFPVYFTVAPGWGIREVTILNVNSRNWTLHDFLSSYASTGNENYIRFKGFHEQHAFEITTCQLIVTGSRSGRRAPTDSFRTGKLKITEQEISLANQKAQKIADMQIFHPSGWKSRNFVEAMLILFSLKDYDHESMVERLQGHPDVLLAKARSLRVDEYLRIFVDKYNHRRQSRLLKINR